MSKEEIESLERELERLEIEFKQNTKRISDKLKKIKARKSLANEEITQEESAFERTNIRDYARLGPAPKIELGDWVEITNDYKYKDKGKVGVVFKFNKPRDRLWLRTPSGQPIERALKNVRKIDKPSWV